MEKNIENSILEHYQHHEHLARLDLDSQLCRAEFFIKEHLETGNSISPLILSRRLEMLKRLQERLFEHLKSDGSTIDSNTKERISKALLAMGRMTKNSNHLHVAPPASIQSVQSATPVIPQLKTYRKPVNATVGTGKIIANPTRPDGESTLGGGAVPEMTNEEVYLGKPLDTVLNNLDFLIENYLAEKENLSQNVLSRRLEMLKTCQAKLILYLKNCKNIDPFAKNCIYDALRRIGNATKNNIPYIHRKIEPNPISQPERRQEYSIEAETHAGDIHHHIGSNLKKFSRAMAAVLALTLANPPAAGNKTSDVLNSSTESRSNVKIVNDGLHEVDIFPKNPVKASLPKLELEQPFNTERSFVSSRPAPKLASLDESEPSGYVTVKDAHEIMDRFLSANSDKVEKVSPEKNEEKITTVNLIKDWAPPMEKKNFWGKVRSLKNIFNKTPFTGNRNDPVELAREIIAEADQSAGLEIKYVANEEAANQDFYVTKEDILRIILEKTIRNQGLVLPGNMTETTLKTVERILKEGQMEGVEIDIRPGENSRVKVGAGAFKKIGAILEIAVKQNKNNLEKSNMHLGTQVVTAADYYIDPKSFMTENKLNYYVTRIRNLNAVTIDPRGFDKREINQIVLAWLMLPVQDHNKIDVFRFLSEGRFIAGKLDSHGSIIAIDRNECLKEITVRLSMASGNQQILEYN